MRGFLFLLCFVGCYPLVDATARLFESTRDRNIFFQTNILLSTTTDSELECIMKCEYLLDCDSAAYHVTDRSCFLYNDLDVMYNGLDIGTVGAAHNGIKNYVKTCPTSKGYHFIAFYSWCFKHHIESIIPEDAYTQCLADYGTILRIDSDVKQETTCSYLDDIGIQSGMAAIQGTREDNTAEWKYDDGTQMQYFKWNSNRHQPENKKKELYIGLDKGRNCLWNDIDITEKMSFICEIKVVP